MKALFIVVFVLGIFFITSFAAFADCPDVDVFCVKMNDEGKITITHSMIAGHYPAGQCWSWWPFGCYPCAKGGELASKCNNSYSHKCPNNICAACVYEAGHYQLSTGTSCFNIRGEEVPVLGSE